MSKKMREIWKSLPAKPAADAPQASKPQGKAKGGAGAKSAAKGDEKVLKIQQSLKDKGFDPGPLDGIMGPKTKAAIKEFQKAKALSADGIAGTKTKAALESDGAAVQGAGAPLPAVDAKSTSGLKSITISPAKPTIISGKQQQFTATGDYADGKQKNVTSLVEWSSAAPKILAVDKKGLGVAGAVAGTTSLTATDRATGVRKTVQVTVAPPGTSILTSIKIEPRIRTIAVGTKQQFTAMGAYSDGREVDLTKTVDWSPSWPDGLSIDNRGRAVAGPSSGPEAMSLTATDLDSDIRDTIDFVVEKADYLGYFGWTRAARAVGQASAKKATRKRVRGRQVEDLATLETPALDLTGKVVWSSSAPDIVSVAANGRVTATATGVNSYGMVTVARPWRKLT